jgi:ankyrin repeat protein
MAGTPDDVRDLVCACKFGDADSVRTMLRRAPNAARDWRPIIEASYKGSASVVEMLIKHGADVNAISSSEHNRPPSAAT